MADELNKNLEPIEGKDLDLKNKFTEKMPAGASEKGPVFAEDSAEKKEGSAEKEGAYSKILSKVQSQAKQPDESSIGSDAEAASREKDAEAKIGKLVDLAMQKGIPHAVKVARHLDDNYTLDEFHDRLLADEFHDALVKKGLLKEL